MDIFLDIGRGFQESVLLIASLLKNPSSPGFVSLLILLVFAACWLMIWKAYKARCQAISWLNNLINKIDVNLYEEVDALTAEIKEQANSKYKKNLGNAWCKYRETFIPFKDESPRVL